LAARLRAAWRLPWRHGGGQRRGRLQPGHLKRDAVTTIQLGLDEAARIGGRVDQIARCAAPRAKSEAVERNQGRLRIAGHRVFL
jgi:hypothetical protein